MGSRSSKKAGISDNLSVHFIFLKISAGFDAVRPKNVQYFFSASLTGFLCMLPFVQGLFLHNIFFTFLNFSLSLQKLPTLS